MKNILLLLSVLLVQACSSAKNSDEGQQNTATSSTTEATICTESSGSEAGCECSTEEGFTTYRFTQGEHERCFTTYANSQGGNQTRPLVIKSDSYTSNALLNPDGVRSFSSKYNVHSIELSSPTGNWDFPLNNRVNLENYTEQCDPESSTEIKYLQEVFKVVDTMIADGLVDENKIYLSGFSQGSMFTIFGATCFPDRIAGINQGGSGLYSQEDGSLALPQCEGACTQEAFAEFGPECVTEEPCEDCTFWPVYPTRDEAGNTFQSCIFMYDNDDAAHSTAVPAHKYLTQAGHTANLHLFESREELGLGGHEMPVLGWEWVNSCLGINPSCSTECESAVLSCVADFKESYALEIRDENPLHSEEGRGLLRGIYEECVMTNSSCLQGCAATEAMLHSVEVPACVCVPGQTDCECTTSDTPGPCENR